MTEAFGYYQIDRKYDDALKILAELKTKAPNIAELVCIYFLHFEAARHAGRIDR